MARDLTLKQRKFAFAMADGTTKSQKDAARRAGYRGNDAVVTVQASENMKNPRILQLIKERTESMVAPSLNALAQALTATKRRAFVTPDCDIVYSIAEPDHALRTRVAERVLDRYERLVASERSEAEVERDHDRVAQQPTDPAPEPMRDDDLSRSDRELLDRVEAIDRELGALDSVQEKHRDDHADEQ
jgi:hypothetical protein